MFNLIVPLLITTSSTIYGWNAMYAAENVPEMRELAFNVLNKKAQAKCDTAEFTMLSAPEYSYNYQGAHYVDHAFMYITCKEKP